MKKLRSQAGETLVETLTAILIVTLVFLFLTTAIVVASKVNAAVRSYDLSFSYDDAAPGASQTLIMTGLGSGTCSVEIETYQDDNTLRFYK